MVSWHRVSEYRETYACVEFSSSKLHQKLLDDWMFALSWLLQWWLQYVIAEHFFNQPLGQGFDFVHLPGCLHTYLPPFNGCFAGVNKFSETSSVHSACDCCMSFFQCFDVMFTFGWQVRHLACKNRCHLSTKVSITEKVKEGEKKPSGNELIHIHLEVAVKHAAVYTELASCCSFIISSVLEHHIIVSRSTRG